MKKLLLLAVLVLTLTACTPDENTANDMQVWYDQCELITTCADKIDELREGELTESAIILEIQTMITTNTLELELQALELERQALELIRQAEEDAILAQRIVDLEYRTTKLENILSISALNTYIQSNDLNPYIELTNIDDVQYQLDVNLYNISEYIKNTPNYPYTISQVKDKIYELIVLELLDIVDTEDVFINVLTVDRVELTLTLQELINLYE